jgi:type I restriction-modification system DNA methylase subunit/predicted DNA-binding transcriptional regulator AlpA
MSTPTSSLTISASDIAQLASVGRSTVSNWRQRHDDFPKPVAGSAASPRFDAGEIRTWLKANGKDVQDLSADRTLWSAMDVWRGVASPEAVGGFASALITWRYVSDPDSPGFDDTLPPQTTWSRLREVVDTSDLIDRIEYGMHAYETSHPERGPLFAAFTRGRMGNLRSEMEQRSGLLLRFFDALSTFDATRIGEAFVAFQDRLTNTARRGYDESATSTALVDLVATLAMSVPGSVHDPVTGSGRMLLAVGSQGQGRATLTGQDINADACAQANQRALVTGHDNVTVRQGDVFQTDYFDRGLAQVVVMDPPYGLSYHHHERLYLDPRLPYGPPPKSSMDTAWLQLAQWYLGNGGRAFVLQPQGSAFQGGAAGRIRAAMLQDGTVEAVVALPGGLASHTQIPLNLWVLARPRETSDPGRVLLLDQSQTKDIDPDTIAEALQGWRDGRVVPTSLPARAITVAEILANEADVTPQRWISAAGGTPNLLEVRAHVEALHRAVAETRPLDKLSSASLTARKRAPKLVTVSDLVKAGSLTVLKANERVREADYSTEGTPVVTGAWIRGDEGQPRRINLSILEHAPVITRPGDVLVQNTGGLAARVDIEGGQALLSPSFQLLRLKSDVVRPYFLAEFLVTISNKRQAKGAAIQRIRLQDMKLPLLPQDEQDRVLERIAEIRSLQTAAQAVLQAASNTRDDLVEAIAAGVVEIT